MGRVEERRLRALERRALEAAREVASMRLGADDLDALGPYLERVLEADAAGAERPRPTPKSSKPSTGGPPRPSAPTTKGGADPTRRRG